jgi:hypothetical protein
VARHGLDRLRGLDVGGHVRRLARTTPAIVLVVAVFVVASLTAIAVSRDPAPVVLSFFALAVSAIQYWRAEFRGPKVTVILLNSPAAEIEKPSTLGHEHYELTVRQPVVIENTGGHPCALAKFRIPGALIFSSGWAEERLAIEDGLGGPWDHPRPVVLVPREPKLFTAAWTLRVPESPSDGKQLDLRGRLGRRAIHDAVRRADLVYSDSGSTTDRRVRIEMNRQAILEAVEQLIIVTEGGVASFQFNMGAFNRARDPIHYEL